MLAQFCTVQATHKLKYFKNTVEISTLNRLLTPHIVHRVWTQVTTKSSKQYIIPAVMRCLTLCTCIIRKLLEKIDFQLYHR